ncbi:MAG TPA: UTP--glucose-1-phosphate uridylyltransferase, partial [Mycobacteriales bacterium]|nr:UTP--glucose-1-phosphate uridylyltransferase [Mycobacteriales bacterium]
MTSGSRSYSPPRKAVIPAAGLGTRFLPATKAVPKELLPVVDTPSMQYIVEEAVSAGLTDVLVVSGRGKEAIADHFDRAPELEAALEKKGDHERLQSVMRPAELADLHFVRQGAPRGLGHAVLCAAPYVGDEPFVVMLPDDMIDARDPLLSRMLEVQGARGGSVIALLEVPHEEVSLYGVVASNPTDEDDVVRITGMVEKPDADEAPSNLIIIGRYLLSPHIFDALRQTDPAHGGEIQLTDAMLRLVEAGEPMH